MTTTRATVKDEPEPGDDADGERVPFTPVPLTLAPLDEDAAEAGTGAGAGAGDVAAPHAVFRHLMKVRLVKPMSGA